MNDGWIIFSLGLIIGVILGKCIGALESEEKE